MFVAEDVFVGLGDITTCLGKGVGVIFDGTEGNAMVGSVGIGGVGVVGGMGVGSTTATEVGVGMGGDSRDGIAVDAGVDTASRTS